MNENTTAPTPPIEFAVVETQLRAAYKAALSNGDSEIAAWYQLIDTYAQRVFDELDALNVGIENGAKVVQAQEKEMRTINEKLAGEILRNENLKAHHDQHTRQLNARLEQDRLEIAALKGQLARQVETHKAELKANDEKHTQGALRCLDLVKNHTTARILEREFQEAILP